MLKTHGYVFIFSINKQAQALRIRQSDSLDHENQPLTRDKANQLLQTESKLQLISSYCATIRIQQTIT